MWTKEWPTEPGWYWCYGYMFKGNDKKKLFSVEVKAPSNANSIFYIAIGHFYYQHEAGDVLWVPATLPVLPDETDVP